MTFKRVQPMIARKPVFLGLAMALFALSGCSLFGSQELSFAGPIIQGVREFHLTTPGSEDLVPLFHSVRDLETMLEWSPDGEQVIVEKERGNFYLADPETGQIGNCLTCDMVDARTAHFSPDGDSIAIGADSGLYLAELSQGLPVQLTDFYRPNWIDWAPDGAKLVFSGRADEDGSGGLGIFLFDLESRERSNLTENMGAGLDEFFSPQWSPDGELIAFHGLNSDGFTINVITPDGTEFRTVTDWTFREGGFFPQSVLPPQWSPDGKRLLFEAYDEANPRFGQDIYAVNIDGSDKGNFTRSPGSDGIPVWSANGRLIAFVSNRDENGEIYVMDADGGNPTNVSNMPLTDELLPFWRP